MHTVQTKLSFHFCFAAHLQSELSELADFCGQHNSPLTMAVSCCAVQMTTVKAKVGEVAALPCKHNIHLDNPLKYYNVYWQKVIGYDKRDHVALSYWQGKEDTKHPDYQNRTKMDQQNFTLWISPVKVSDEGKYKCIILSNSTDFSALNLSVVADFSKPVIHAEIPPNACGSTLLTLRCSSHGGYPKANMSGLLNNETVEWIPIFIPDNQTELFNITSNLQQNLTGDILFQCSVSYPGFQTSTSYNFTIPKECSVVNPLPHWIVIASSVILVCLVVVAALANIQCCKRQRSCCHTTSHQSMEISEINAGAALTPLQLSSHTSED
ncbi:T-lymphocyte activation antigen CD80 [Eublepharis macularius]|uniref:T-lymphocyte activation antigen CD80 n=1 Tax=Eublepharis macularius TaxID=481883 RepID=A0AA97J3C2_EUBMA|nr:T-lymphocyte activation antigen CD80 [Eublepharis macularius]